jgi:hypothetical protein
MGVLQKDRFAARPKTIPLTLFCGGRKNRKPQNCCLIHKMAIDYLEKCGMIRMYRYAPKFGAGNDNDKLRSMK